MTRQYEPPGSRSRRRRRKFVLVGGALAAVIVAVVLFLIFQDKEDQRVAVDMPDAGPPTATTTMGKPVQDGQIEFLVESIRPLQVSPGPPPVSVQVVKVRMTNTGTSPQLVASRDQVLVDNRGQEYSPDPLSAELGTGQDAVIDLQPGETQTVSLPFDVVPDAKPTAVVLHAAPRTPGVEVTLPR